MASAKREPTSPNGDKRYVRDEKGRFKESDDVGRSLSQDHPHKARTLATSDQATVANRRVAERDPR